jgi:hypothetical protein
MRRSAALYFYAVLNVRSFLITHRIIQFFKPIENLFIENKHPMFRLNGNVRSMICFWAVAKLYIRGREKEKICPAS